MRKEQVSLYKRSTNKLNPDTMSNQLDNIIRKAIGTTFAGFGWRGKVESVESNEENGGQLYTARLVFYKRQQRERSNSDEVFAKQYADIERKLATGCRSAGWTTELQPVSTALVSVHAEVGTSQPRPEFHIPEPDSPFIKTFFGHIFDRDAQIRTVALAIRKAYMTGFRKRSHCALFGKPACGKTEILSTFIKVLGSHNVIKLDATSTTKAGAENLLLELAPNIPNVIILEEAEKTNPANLPWLLGVMDQRAEIIKTNARVGTLRCEAKCLVLATVNDMPLFKSLMSGALASRFSHHLYCPRPTREVLRKILLREVNETGGRESWIEPALDYLEEEGSNDPRRAIALLDGEDALLSGAYQKDQRTIRESMKADGVME